MNAEVIEEFYSRSLERLRSSGFKTTEGVKYRGQTFTCVAKRTAFEGQKYGFVETFFLFAEFDDIDVGALGSYCRTCFAYALRKSRIPLPRGLFHSVECYCVALAYGIDSVVGEAVRGNEPPRHWAAAEIPVICDLATR